MEPEQKVLKQFKSYPKNERASEYEKGIIRLNTKGPRLVHEMVLNYEYIFYQLDLLQKNLLHKPLEKVKLMDSFKVYLYDGDLQNDMILQNLSQKMKSLSSLRILQLQFPFANWISLKGVELLASALTQMKLLERIIMNFHYAEWVNDENLHLLFKTLKKNKNLQSFTLVIPHCLNVTEKSFKSLASALKHSPQSLKELELGLSYLDFTEGKALDFLASGLANLKSLQIMRVHFQNIEIGPADNFVPFMCSIKHLKSLRELVLNFSQMPINASILKHLATSFKSLKHLHTLSLILSSCPAFSIEEMEVLAECLQSVAPSLKKLSLNFSHSANVNNEALEKLSVGLKALTNLSEIELRCDHCLSIGDSGVESVTYEIGGLENLHSVNLSFSGCCPIKKAYYNGLKMNKNIKKLVFEFIPLNFS